MYDIPDAGPVDLNAAIAHHEARARALRAEAMRAAFHSLGLAVGRMFHPARQPVARTC